MAALHYLALAAEFGGAVEARDRWLREADILSADSHLATWLALRDEDPGCQVSAHVERELRTYLECGILAHGFARAFCDACGHDFLIAFSCKSRGVCALCNARRMVARAAHLAD